MGGGVARRSSKWIFTPTDVSHSDDSRPMCRRLVARMEATCARISVLGPALGGSILFGDLAALVDHWRAMTTAPNFCSSEPPPRLPFSSSGVIFQSVTSAGVTVG